MFGSVEPIPAINGLVEIEEDLNEAMILSYAARRPKERAAFMRQVCIHISRSTMQEYHCQGEGSS